MSTGERVMGAIPGTHEYEAQHGMTGAHRAVEQGKAMIPGVCAQRRVLCAVEVGPEAGVSTAPKA